MAFRDTVLVNLAIAGAFGKSRRVIYFRHSEQKGKERPQTEIISAYHERLGTFAMRSFIRFDAKSA